MRKTTCSNADCEETASFFKVNYFSLVKSILCALGLGKEIHRMFQKFRTFLLMFLWHSTFEILPAAEF